MSYSYYSMFVLGSDPNFQGRARVCAYQECQAHLDDPDHPDWSNMAYDTLRAAGNVMDAWVRMVARTPAVADEAGDPPDQTLIDDATIQTAVNDSLPLVASLWYNPDGTPWNGMMMIPGTEPVPVPPVQTTVTGVAPTTSTTPVDLTVTGTGLTGTTNVNVNNDCTNLVVVDDNTVTATMLSAKKGTFPVIVTVHGVNYTGPDFVAT